MKACYIRPIVYRGYDTLGVNPLPLPGRRRDHGVGMGRVPRRRTRSSNGVDVKVSSLVAHGAQHAAGDGQEPRPTTPTPR